MIRYLRHNEIDFQKWDACVSHSINGLLYAYSWFLDMTAHSWDALVENDYETIMPLPFRKKFGLTYLYQPFFIQQLGVFSTVSISQEIVERFIRAIPKKIIFADINLNTYNKLNSSKNSKLYHLRTYEMDLLHGHADLERAYSENTRRNLKKAVKHGVFIAQQGRPEEIIEAFRQNRGKRLRSFGKHDYFVLKHLVYSGIHKGLVRTYSAYTEENTFCAGAFFFISRNKAVFLFSGITEAGRKNGAMFMLIDHFIREHAGQELVLDFEGSSDNGLARFYRGFGSKECLFLRLVMNRLPCLIRPVLLAYTVLRHGRSVPSH